MIINLWNPSYEGLYAAIVISYLLGIVHGITPDEHTWPITFSYAVGNYSTKGGAKAGLVFSAGFTVERALMSEIAALALASFMFYTYFNSIVYVIVGAVMALSGFYIANKLKYPHIHIIEESLYRIFGIHKHNKEREKLELEHMENPVMVNEDGVYRPVPTKLAFVHGLIAGFGFGAFALIIYFVIAPNMPIYLGFLPGLMFGLGTMTMQVLAGTLFGLWLSKKKDLTVNGIAFVARGISHFVLSYGGITFVIAGIVTLIFPQLWNYQIITGIKIHNLDALGLPFFLVVLSVLVIGYLGYKINLNKAVKMEMTNSANGSKESTPQ
ncbi:TVG1290876 [Thermoplasma volcanium GSS1]|uniref:TVG1290876 protein n=1 Tax=Thermoplasma volcanium (strain ATCC 51530 / DSM 4299 / JCM 9571 / NBRC 15438 / GSS1) TaxID=273116 RepID=Q979A9_THEVO|nr:hypothetical protein [Thermoplasma volcanium]BAB60395.1 TVG1290876 [Thermoplasma volcanium GSS1]